MPFVGKFWPANASGGVRPSLARPSPMSMHVT
eukprot:CAMPEP_0168367162 /NCGR_PEP_ID=MMETSP0228-20121227/5596_1 /TAXON_ID=133427 /ORGANISM="Protoceratium reticulatum, Strain CCCM 535 (=CCMP 1889)" /LENGTH=31 /DNA_ID= /DNA_START= /DNA_END= /DNA_ORIENTATION=